MARIDPLRRIEFDRRACGRQDVLETGRVDFQRSFASVMKLPAIGLGQANRHRLQPETSRDVAGEERDGIGRFRRQENVASQVE